MVQVLEIKSKWRLCEETLEDLYSPNINALWCVYTKKSQMPERLRCDDEESIVIDFNDRRGGESSSCVSITSRNGASDIASDI